LDTEGNNNNSKDKEKNTNMSETDSKNKNWYFLFNKVWSFVKYNFLMTKKQSKLALV
jgi:hypothetical protein